MRKASILAAILAAGAAALPAAAEPQPIERLLSTLQFRGTIGLSGGFDSNPGEEAVPEGSAFGRLDGVAHLEVGESGGTRAYVDVEAAAQRYADDVFEDEYRYEVDLQLRQPIGDGLEVSVGAERKRDATDDPPSTDDNIWAKLAVETPLVQFEVRGTINEYREDVDRAEIEDDDLEVFDERIYSARVRARVETGLRLRPVIEARVSAVDYLERRPGKPERDALEYSAMAGVAVAVADNLTVQMGLRRNERFFESADADSHANFGPDVEISWEPSDRSSIQIWLNPAFEEPSFEDGLIRDVISAGVDWTHRATDRLRFKGGASAAEKREIGTDYRKTDLEGYAEGRFALRPNLVALVGFYVDREVRHDDPDSTFTRAAVRTGVEASF